MQEERLKYLFDRYFKKQATPEELDEFFALAQLYDNENMIQEMMEQHWESFISTSRPFSEQDRDLMMEEILHIELNPKKDSNNDIRHSRLWPRIWIAAAIATIIISTGIWFYQSANNQTDVKQIAYINDVAPGSKGARLTLANGKKIRLTDAANGLLAQESDVVITKTATGQLIYEIRGNSNETNAINTLTTDIGETYQVRLPDGSSVWLNAASSLIYPTSFAGLKARKVELTGEGYFEIAKDKAHPFIVKTDKQEVEVLGTRFNINAYADEKAIATTLLEGSVKLTTGNHNLLLKPGEQAVNTDETIKVKAVDIDTVVDWKNEEFFLDKMDFRVAMRKIGRWYNVEVIYNGSVPANLEAGGWIPRNSKLSDVIKSIESTGQVHFRIEGRKLYVSR